MKLHTHPALQENYSEITGKPNISLFSRTTFFYLLICCLSFMAAYFALNALEARRLSALHGSTLFYTKQDAASFHLATQFGGKMNIRTIDLLSPGAGKALHDLT